MNNNSIQYQTPLDFFANESETKCGYEIPFTREPCKYVASRKSSGIFAYHKVLEAAETELMNKILGA